MPTAFWCRYGLAAWEFDAQSGWFIRVGHRCTSNVGHGHAAKVARLESIGRACHFKYWEKLRPAWTILTQIKLQRASEGNVALDGIRVIDRRTLYLKDDRVRTSQREVQRRLGASRLNRDVGRRIVFQRARKRAHSGPRFDLHIEGSGE